MRPNWPKPAQLVWPRKTYKTSEGFPSYFFIHSTVFSSFVLIIFQVILHSM